MKNKSQTSQGLHTWTVHWLNFPCSEAYQLYLTCALCKVHEPLLINTIPHLPDKLPLGWEQGEPHDLTLTPVWPLFPQLHPGHDPLPLGSNKWEPSSGMLEVACIIGAPVGGGSGWSQTSNLKVSWVSPAFPSSAEIWTLSHLIFSLCSCCFFFFSFTKHVDTVRRSTITHKAEFYGWALTIFAWSLEPAVSLLFIWPGFILFSVHHSSFNSFLLWVFSPSL